MTATAPPYEPDAGDLIWIDCDPQAGREQRGHRPALVLSPVAFVRATGLAIVCPITSHVRPFRSSVVLPAGLAVSGEILCAHVRSVDVVARGVKYAGGRVPPATLGDTRAKVAALIGLTS